MKEHEGSLACCTCLIMKLEDAASALRWRVACTYAEDWQTAASQPAVHSSHRLMLEVDASE